MTLNEYIDSIKHKRICVIGIGVSNTPLIKKLLASGCDVTACDKRTAEQLGQEHEELSNLGAKFCLGEDYLEHLDFDIVFRTPGLMPFDGHLQKVVERTVEGRTHIGGVRLDGAVHHQVAASLEIAEDGCHNVFIVHYRCLPYNSP